MSRLFIVALLMLSSACSVVPKQPALHDFGIPRNETSSSNEHITTATKADISLDTPSWLMNECIHYRLLYASPTQLRCYNLDKWIAPPAELFKQQLQASGKFSTHRLAIQLLDFEQQFDNPKQAQVVLHFIVNVYALDAERLLASHDFRLAQTTSTPDAAGAVAGFSHLIQQATVKLQQWLITIK